MLLHRIIAILLASTILAADQATKWLAVRTLEDMFPPVIEITSFFNIVLVYNTGVSFGMLNDLEHGKILLSLLASAIVIGLMIWSWRTTVPLLTYTINVIIGGAIGNIIDRTRIGAVVDFLDFHLSNYHWPAFNIADMAVCIGIFILCIDSIFLEKKRLSSEHTATEQP